MISILPHRQRRRNRRTIGQLTTQKELSQSRSSLTFWFHSSPVAPLIITCITFTLLHMHVAVV